MVGPLRAGEAPNEEVEVLIEGKRYRSSRDYKREKFKDALAHQLSESILRDFSDDEILEIIAEIRKSHQDGKSLPPLSQAETQDPANPSLTLPPDIADDPDPDGSEMQKMLNKYKQEHAGADAVILNPEKVRNIFIPPKHKVENPEN